MKVLCRFAPVLVGCPLLLSSALIFGAIACGPSEKEPMVAQVKPGPMPEEGKWRGVYYSPIYGYLHLVTDGASVSGKWRNAEGDKWGELNGKTDGDLLKFQWIEHKIGMFGPSADTEGHGYFRYVVPKTDNSDHELKGEWGLGESDAGNPWNAIKQRNLEPDPDSVMPDESQNAISGGDWDGKKSDAASGGEEAPPPEDDKKDEGSGSDSEGDWE
jgi:hypothetical protein